MSLKRLLLPVKSIEEATCSPVNDSRPTSGSKRVLKKEMSLFEATNNLPNKLGLLKEAPLTIQCGSKELL